jgi:hypothetical protein
MSMIIKNHHDHRENPSHIYLTYQRSFQKVLRRFAPAAWWRGVHSFMKVVKKFETVTTVIRYMVFALPIILALTGILPTDGGDVRYEIF